MYGDDTYARWTPRVATAELVEKVTRDRGSRADSGESVEHLAYQVTLRHVASLQAEVGRVGSVVSGSSTSRPGR
jgi:hypothetical protein